MADVPRRKKNARERRQQRERASIRAAQMMLRGRMELRSHRGNALGKAGSLVMQSLSLVVASPAAHWLPMPNFSRKAAKEEGLMELGRVPVVTVEMSCSARVPVGTVPGPLPYWNKVPYEKIPAQ